METGIAEDRVQVDVLRIAEAVVVANVGSAPVLLEEEVVVADLRKGIAAAIVMGVVIHDAAEATVTVVGIAITRQGRSLLRSLSD